MELVQRTGRRTPVISTARRAEELFEGNEEARRIRTLHQVELYGRHLTNRGISAIHHVTRFAPWQSSSLLCQDSAKVFQLIQRVEDMR